MGGFFCLCCHSFKIQRWQSAKIFLELIAGFALLIKMVSLRKKLRLHTTQRKKVGLSPGALIHVGEKRTEPVKITLFDYDQHEYVEQELMSIEEALAYKEKHTVTWLNLDGIHDVEILRKVGEHYHIHPLVLEDVLNTGQRPKIENYDGYLFIVTKMLTYNEETKLFQRENVSIILGQQFVFTFQEKEGDVLRLIRERIRADDSRMRRSGPDYLVYRILDTIVDHYFIVLEKYGDRIEELEVEVMEDPDEETLNQIHQLKRELLLLRKPIWPMREVLNNVQRTESKLVEKDTRIFLRDIYDHIVQITDTIDNFRELVSGLLDIYLSNVSNRMNEVMKVLTIIATIFIPLTFLAGVYGMNFEYMPELKWRWGYFAVWGIMVILGLFMFGFFKKKKWF